MQRDIAAADAPPRGGRRVARALAGSLSALAGALLVSAALAPATWAARATSGIQMHLTQFIDGVQSTKPIFWGTVVHYQLDVTNTTGSPSNSFSIVVPMPRDGIYVANSATCGTVPNCNATENFSSHDNLIFAVAELDPGATGTLAFDVTLRIGAQYQTIAEVAHLFGDGCSAAVCSSNKAVNHVLPRPVSLLGFPNNGLPSPPGSNIIYVLNVKNPSQHDQPNVVVNDGTPIGTNYIAGSATCLKSPGCTVDDTGGNITYHFDDIPVHPGKRYKVQYSVQVAVPSGNIVNTAAWLGDLCSIGPCATNTVQQPVAGAAVTATTGAVGVSKSASPSSVQPGQKLTYTLALSNSSSSAQNNVVVHDIVPTGTTYVPGSASCRASGCTASESGGTVTFSLSSVGPNSTNVTLTFSVTVGAAVGSTITNVGNWTGGGCSASGGCPTNAVTTPVVATAPGGGSGGAGGSGGPGGSGGATGNTGPVGGVTQIHTGLPWAGSRPYVLGVLGLGLLLIGSGLLWREIIETRRRRLEAPATTSP